ncbi:helix-turn-helix transcriptional regulator [Caballeronia grimmiae]|uniref:helix-turn-helix transcriptional regulator n=1 Tax=Caballeronia grimmiae TaxID=1071679 RepID=UPI0038B7F154
MDLRDEARADFDGLRIEKMPLGPNNAEALTRACFAAEVCVYLKDAPRAARLYRMLRSYAGTILLLDIGGPRLGAADRLLALLSTVEGRWERCAAAFRRRRGTTRVVGRARKSRTGVTPTRACCAHAERPTMRRSLATCCAMRSPKHESSKYRHSSCKLRLLPGKLDAPSYPCGLTRRAVEVLRLVAIGRNNRDNASVLQTSADTVANYIRNIPEKTYTANPTEAAAFAVRQACSMLEHGAQCCFERNASSAASKSCGICSGARCRPFWIRMRC